MLTFGIAFVLIARVAVRLSIVVRQAHPGTPCACNSLSRPVQSPVIDRRLHAQ